MKSFRSWRGFMCLSVEEKYTTMPTFCSKSIMKLLEYFLCFNLLFISFLAGTSAAESENNGIYIVYMGATHSSNGDPRNDHAQLLSSLMKRKIDVLYTYNHGFLGFTARLSEEEAKSIAERPGVVSVFPDPVLKLHTTHSWDFLKSISAMKMSYTPTSITGLSSGDGEDTIIGILDTGIWPESQSFNDPGMGPIPSRWKGKCMEGLNFTASHCNKKLIGARYYYDTSGKDMGTSRDGDGHGTHVASTAAGRPVSGASYYGLANGTAVGGSPGSRIAMYRACKDGDCDGSAILKAFDDAIADGVDVLSLSLGYALPFFFDDPVAIGAFHATEKGIIVVCAAGNSGPFPASVENFAPWILTVGATTIDRDFESNVVLGGNKVIKGRGINFSNLTQSPVYPLIDGKSSKSKSNQTTVEDASNCIPGSLDGDNVKGKIVLCGNMDIYSVVYTYEYLKEEGAVGMIFIDNDACSWQDPLNYQADAIVSVTEKDGDEIQSYINSTSKPLATILPTVTVLNYKPAPVVACFSSRGPTPGIQNLLKPDIAAPGVAILAAWPTNVSYNSEVVPGRDPPLFAILSGTSMSCPHVSGLAAAIKSRHPTWSPSAIRSAIMTTAIQEDNLHAPFTTIDGSRASPYDVGAGVISLSGPFQPGLVYETETMDYIQFLCNTGYNTTSIRFIAGDVIPVNFSCPVDSNLDSVSNMNYPSIAISFSQENETTNVTRYVTNVGEEESIYTAIIDAPAGLNVQVKPNKLHFTKDVKKTSFQVRFKQTTKSLDQDLFGSITWSNDKYKVRSPFVVAYAGKKS